MLPTYLQQHPEADLDSGSLLFDTDTAGGASVSARVASGSRVTLIVACNAGAGHATVYQNGTYEGDGPCGSENVVSFTPPAAQKTAKITYSVKIDDAQQFEFVGYEH